MVLHHIFAAVVIALLIVQVFTWRMMEFSVTNASCADESSTTLRPVTEYCRHYVDVAALFSFIGCLFFTQMRVVASVPGVVAIYALWFPSRLTVGDESAQKRAVLGFFFAAVVFGYTLAAFAWERSSRRMFVDVVACHTARCAAAFHAARLTEVRSRRPRTTR